jgi:hypothetical protein
MMMVVVITIVLLLLLTMAVIAIMLGAISTKSKGPRMRLSPLLSVRGCTFRPGGAGDGGLWRGSGEAVLLGGGGGRSEVRPGREAVQKPLF